MKLTEIEAVGKSIGLEGSSFSIAVDSDFLVEAIINLYSRPVEAVVRELVSNAYDASLESVENRALVIIETDKMYIKDYGTGMSPEFMRTLYTKIGHSEKRESETAIGCYGMGRLSILAVSGSYEVITNFEGNQYTWLVWKDGKIKIDLLSEKESEIIDGVVECGTTVAFPITDQYKWFRTCTETLHFFPKLKVVKMVGGEVVDEYKPEPLYYELEGVKYGLGNSNNLRLILGKVMYDIDFKELGISEVYSNFLLNFELTSGLKPQPSRESLIYDEKTKKLILEQIKVLENIVEKQFFEKLSAAPNILEKAKVARMHNYSVYIEDRGYQVGVVNYAWPHSTTTWEIVNGENYLKGWKNHLEGKPRVVFYLGNMPSKIKQYLSETYNSVIRVQAIPAPGWTNEENKAIHAEVLNLYIEKCETQQTIEKTLDYQEWLVESKKTKKPRVTGDVSYFRTPMTGNADYVKDKISLDNLLRSKVVYYNVPEILIKVLVRTKEVAVVESKPKMLTQKQEQKFLDFMESKKTRLILKALLQDKVNNILNKADSVLLQELFPEVNKLLLEYNELTKDIPSLSRTVIDYVVSFRDELVTDFPIETLEEEVGHLYLLSELSGYRAADREVLLKSYRNSRLAALVSKSKMSWLKDIDFEEVLKEPLEESLEDSLEESSDTVLNLQTT